MIKEPIVREDLNPQRTGPAASCRAKSLEGDVNKSTINVIYLDPTDTESRKPVQMWLKLNSTVNQLHLIDIY